MKKIIILIISVMSLACQNFKPHKKLVMENTQSNNLDLPDIYDFSVPGLTGGAIDFSEFKGKKILVVNTASKCGLTPQYEGLEKLYQAHKDKLVIIGFPANDFMSQEPGSNEDIAAFCQKNYGVSFLMAEKITVKDGSMHPLYLWLTQKSRNGVMDSEVSWNFQKYLLNENGQLIGYFSPQTDPQSPEIIEAVNAGW